MAEEQKTPEAAAAAEKPARGGGIVQMLLTVVLSGAAAFGGAYLGAPKPPGEKEHVDEEMMPGPTIPMKAFVLNVYDEKGASHALKITLAVELAKEAKPEEFALFEARARDATLSYLRSQTYERMIDSKHKEKLTEELLGVLHTLGAQTAKSVLIQDMVIQ